MTLYTNFIGIDIGKFEIVAGLHGSKSVKTFPNTQEGFNEFFANFRSMAANALFILETTGGYERLFLDNLLKKQTMVHRANTRQVKAFIRSLGIRGKTDSIDALALARYGYERHDRLKLYEPLDVDQRLLASLAERHLDLTQNLVQEKNRRKAPDTPLCVQKSCDRVIRALESEIKEIAEKMEDLIKTMPTAKAIRKVLETIPGIGKIISRMLVALLPELGHLNRREIASLVGLAPHPNESGTRCGHRSIKGGRRDIRSILFMAGMTASRSKGKLGEKYKDLIGRGKKRMVAIVAIMRKIIVMANFKIKDLLAELELSTTTYEAA